MTVTKHDDIADTLTRDILLGQYRLGERLPSERDLANRFDANRGAVREAMKKLEQLRIVTIHKGGARVAPLDEASLDIIGPLMAIGPLPDGELVDQILQVVSSLIRLAGENAVQRATDQELKDIRELVAPLRDAKLSGSDHTQARIKLLSSVMTASGNLPCQLIARSLLLQFAPRMAALEGYFDVDVTEYAAHARLLDDAMAARDVAGVSQTLAALSVLNRAGVMRALDAVRADREAMLRLSETSEVAAS